MTARFIGISGKPGSNKLFYAFRIIRELRLRGYKTELLSFAKPLYEELNNIADEVKNNVPFDEIVKNNNLPTHKGFELLELLNPVLIGEKDEVYGYSRRNEYFRQALNILGTEIRREQDVDYYVKKVVEESNNLDIDFIVLIDLRFPNEADYINFNNKGMTIRVNVFDESLNYGGYKYNEGMKTKAETALDDYYMFSYEFYRELFNGVDFGFELEKFFELTTE